jgi:hypothetical protein
MVQNAQPAQRLRAQARLLPTGGEIDDRGVAFHRIRGTAA